jgi:hypothetical protein
VNLRGRDLNAFASFIELGIFVPITWHRLDASRGIILVRCADDTSKATDIFRFGTQHLPSSLCESGALPVYHLSLLGGPLLIPRGSPIAKSGNESELLLAQLKELRKRTSINTVVLLGEAPCETARAAELDLREYMSLLVMAKMLIKSELEGVKVACFSFITRYGAREAYFVSQKRYMLWSTH